MLVCLCARRRQLRAPCKGPGPGGRILHRHGPYGCRAMLLLLRLAAACNTLRPGAAQGKRFELGIKVELWPIAAARSLVTAPVGCKLRVCSPRLSCHVLQLCRHQQPGGRPLPPAPPNGAALQPTPPLLPKCLCACCCISKTASRSRDHSIPTPLPAHHQSVAQRRRCCPPP